MRLQDIATVAAAIDRIKLTQNDEGRWEVAIFLTGKGSQEHKVTKFHYRDEPRTWKSLDKAVRTLETTFDRRFEELEMAFRK
jgi:hypothetical protein